jgi:hypothetical protein
MGSKLGYNNLSQNKEVHDPSSVSTHFSSIVNLFFMFSNFYQLYLHNETYVALANLRRNIFPKQIENWTFMV